MTFDTPSILSSPDLQLRFLQPCDLSEIRVLCEELFPVEYAVWWYEELARNQIYYSIVTVYQNKIIGLLVAEIKNTETLPPEDSRILKSGTSNQIGYIVSLGVISEYQKLGVASFMLDNLMGYLTSTDHKYKVKAIYLHVLTTNWKAISFYEKRGFKPHLFLPHFYNIKGKRKDGFVYVLYINDGHPPWNVIETLCYAIFSVCLGLFKPWTLFHKLNQTWLHVRPKIRQVAQSSTAIFS